MKVDDDDIDDDDDDNIFQLPPLLKVAKLFKCPTCSKLFVVSGSKKDMLKH